MERGKAMTNDERKYELAENLREDYYMVYLFTEESNQYEDYDMSFLMYGTPIGIVSTMDAVLMNAGYGESDWSTMSAVITYDQEEVHDILYMSDLTGPEYEIVTDTEVLEALQA